MDQLKTALAVAMKYGFWIGSAVVLLGSLAVWYLSTSTLAEEMESESSRLEGQIRKISTVEGAMPTAPNDDSHEKMKEMIKQRQDEVLESWRTLFDRQKPYLTWPVDELQKDFVEKYEGKIPIEQYIKFPPEENELSRRYLERYRDFIKGEPAKLAKIAGAVWTASEEKRRSSISLGDNSDNNSDLVVDEVPVVAWSTSSQQDLEKDLFRWSGDTPTTLEIYYSQESQWVLKQLLTIIKEVNGEASQPYQAKIREIKEIKIGASVNFNVGEISSIQGSSSIGGGMSGGAMGGGMGGNSMGSSLGGGAMGGGSFGRGGGGSTVDPAEGRYVDQNLEPITASALRSALQSNKPSDASLAVAKRVPVMMGLKMDQRTIHELLAACGSADLMVEVTHVRVLGESSGRGGGGGSRRSGGLGGGGLGGGGGGLGGLGSGSGSRANTSSSAEFEEYPFDVDVEIYGMIYIYNPPDPAKLPVEQVTKETVEEALGEIKTDEPPPAETAPVEGQPLEQENGELQPPAAAATTPGEANEGDAVSPPSDTPGDGDQPAAGAPTALDAAPPPANAEPPAVAVP